MGFVRRLVTVLVALLATSVGLHEAPALALDARVPVANGPVGVVGRTGQLTDWLKITRTDTGFVHGWPSNG